MTPKQTNRSLLVLERCISETARSLLWLWRNDPTGWAIERYSVTHRGARVGVWIGNSVYGLYAAFNIPERDAAFGFMFGGDEVKLKWIDRLVLYRAFKKTFKRDLIPVVISEWAAKSDRFIEKVD